MKNTGIGTFLAIALIVNSPNAWSDNGVGYSAEAAALVYGGIDFGWLSQAMMTDQSVYMEQPGKGPRKLLYRSKGIVSGVAVAPSGAMVALMERTHEEGVAPERANYVVRDVDDPNHRILIQDRVESRLTLLNLDGKVVRTIDDVYRFSWSPGGDRIAFITGRYSENDIGFEPTGTWIHDITTQRTTNIHKRGQNLEWAAWDGNIYIDVSLAVDTPDGAVVLEFAPASGQLAPSRHVGIRFSPDGRFYYRDGGEGEVGGEVFETATDRQVTLAPLTELGKAVDPVAMGWLGSSTLIMRPPGGSDRADHIQDLRGGERLRLNGRVGATDGAGKVFVVRDDAFVEQTVSLR